MLEGKHWLGAAFVLLAAGCTHEHLGGVDAHYGMFSAELPRNATVSVCHAYGCRKQTRYTFKPAEIAELGKVMAKSKKSDTPAEERRAVAYAIGWMETRVGEALGTKEDRPGMDFAASGDPTQQDCVDEATNTTSYLLVLQNQGLLKHHTVGTPFAKENYLRGVSGWTHWTAVLNDTDKGQRWAVDSWIYANGENPAIVEAENWYMTTLAELPKSTR
jgi:hypothetical protein